MVSVVIRNRNEARHLEKVLSALSVQEGVELEIILVDNNSTDDSVAIAESYGAKVVNLKNFTYGRGLNVGLREAKGDICILLSAHSVPLGKNFVLSCLGPFENPRIAAVRCVYARKPADVSRWTRPEILDSLATWNDVIAKGPLASGCAIRRSVWSEIPFDETVIAAEEKIWAKAVLDRGYMIHSPVGAFYDYIKQVGPLQTIRKTDRELRAIYRAQGRPGAVKRARRVFLSLRSMFRQMVQTPTSSQ